MTEIKTETLKALLSEKCDEKKFPEIGSELMRKWSLRANDDIYDIVEIEFYLYNAAHADPYVHKSKEQFKTAGDWYFHREKSAKKSFTLKGLDLTFGKADEDYGGILIRALRKSALITEGPSKVVDLILDANGVESVLELKELGYSGDAFEYPILHLVEKKTPIKEAILIGPRFGLKKKQGDTKFHAALYRYRMFSDKTKKDKASLRKPLGEVNSKEGVL